MQPQISNMISRLPNQPGKPAGLFFNRVGRSLYRLKTTRKYYALLKQGGKQFRRLPKTASASRYRHRL